MVAATIQIKSAVFLFSFALLSCQNQIIISENQLIGGLEIPRYVRTNQFSGTISVMYDNDTFLKSKRQYKDGKKNGKYFWYDEEGEKIDTDIFEDDKCVKMCEGDE